LLLALATTLGAQAAAVYWPPLQTLLQTTGLGVAEWQMIGLFTLPLIILPELFKMILMRRRANGT
jgi:Ca2+-transporting ATPase